MPENNLKNIKEIFEKAKNSDKNAFSVMNEVYFEPLYRYVYLRIGNKAEADDLIQDIFIKVYNSSEDSVCEDTSMLINFYSIAGKNVSDWKRKRRDVISIDDNVENYSDLLIDSDESLKKEEFEQLQRALKKLTSEQQDVVIFKFVEELSVKEIMKILGKTESSISRIQSDGIRLIRDILKNSISNITDKKNYSVIEEAFLLKDKGKSVSYIVGKFPGYEEDIREHFGIVAFLKKVADKIVTPKNILKIIISRIPNNSIVQKLTDCKQEIPKMQEKPIFIVEEGKTMSPENNILSNKFKIIIFAIALIILSIIFLKKDSNQNDFIEKKNMEMFKKIDILQPAGNINDILPAVGSN